MIIGLRRILFVMYAVVFRIPMWAIVWLVGLTGVIKTVFVIYPHDQKEYRRLCPNYKWFVRFLSGRPIPGGIIADGFKPIGIYCYISNTPQELVKKKNRQIAESIVRRMEWIRKISGARACGFAGQLGPILEKRHNTPMEPPFFSSTMGNVFSIDDAISCLSKKRNKSPWQLSIAVVGGGELGETLHDHFSSQGYKVDIIDVKCQRRGGVEIKDMETAKRQLAGTDYVVNLLQKGEEFISCGIGDVLEQSTSVIDFSRPAIPREQLRAKVFMGNRVQRSGMRFAFALPGWDSKELPACSIPSILASHYGIVEDSYAKFCDSARKVAFETALITTPQPAPNPFRARVHALANHFMVMPD